MNLFKRIGIDAYMILLMLTAVLGVVLPARGIGAEILGYLTYWAVAVLFFLYGGKLDPRAVRAGLLNWKLQGLTFATTYAVFPVMGFALIAIFGRALGPEMSLGLLFLAVLPSTVQSSIAFTSISGGNVAAAICAASLSNIVGVVLTPLLVAQLIHLEGAGVTFEAIEKIGLQILLPFVAGQLLRRWIGATLNRRKLLTTIVDRGSILLIVFAAFSAGTVAGVWSSIPPASLLVTLGVVLLLLFLIIMTTRLAGRAAGLPPEDRTTLLFCGSTKSLASGLPIAMALFPAAQVSAIILPVMIYHMVQLLVCSGIAGNLSARAAAAPAPIGQTGKEERQA